MGGMRAVICSRYSRDGARSLIIIEGEGETSSSTTIVTLPLFPIVCGSGSYIPSNSLSGCLTMKTSPGTLEADFRAASLLE